ncbi:phospholipid carrier-dependent glycosyltransferase [Pseudomonas sp. H3_E06]
MHGTEVLNSRDDILPRFSLKYAVVLLVLLASAVVGVYGFSTLELASMNSGTRTILLSLAGLAALTVFTRKPPIILCLGLLACLSIVCAQIWPVMVVAVFALSSTVLGRWLLRQDALDDWSVHLLVGAGTFGTLTGLAAYLPINYPWLYGALLLLPLVLGHRHVTSIGRELLRQIRASRSAQTPLQTGFDVLICSFACLYVLVAFMPEVGHDALAMHLFVPSHLAQQHQWKFDANTYVWAVMPMLADWIYSIVYMLAGETASRLSNSAFTLLLAWQIRNMTLWAGGSATSARWASLIFLSTPLAFAESSSLHIESAWTAFMMAGTLAILKVSSFTPEPRERLSQLLLAGLLLGFAMATKAVTLSVLPVLLVILLLHYKAWAVPGIVKTLLLGSAGLILAGATPYVSAGYLTGNPVFPFFNAIFHSPLWPDINFEPPAIFGTGVTWDTLYRMVFKSPQFIEGRVGAAGFQWLLLPTAAVAVLLSGNKKALCILLVGAGAMFMTFHSTAYLRYVFPLLRAVLSDPGPALFRRQDLPAQPRHRGQCRVDPDQYPFHPGRDLLWRNQTLCTVEHDRSGCLSIGTPAHPKNGRHRQCLEYRASARSGLCVALDGGFAWRCSLRVVVQPEMEKRVRRGGLAIRTCPALAPAPGELAGDRPQVPSPGTTRSAAHGVHVVCQTG